MSLLQAAEASKLMMCGHCFERQYCSKACQARDWPGHNFECNEIAMEKREAHAHMNMCPDGLRKELGFDSS